MLYAFWLVDAKVIACAADHGPLANGRLLGYSLALTLAEELAVAEIGELPAEALGIDAGGRAESEGAALRRGRPTQSSRTRAGRRRARAA